jgi:zinc transport system substrate-binding protein
MVLMFGKRVVLSAVSVALVLAGCSSSSAPTGRLRIVASIFPLGYIARAVAGADADVTVLTASGVEPHDQELTAQKVRAIESADAIVYVRGLAPAVDAAVGAAVASHARTAIDALAVIGTHRRSGDPHMWLNPQLLGMVASDLATQLARIHPADATTYRANAVAVRSDLAALDAEFRNATRSCQSQLLITTHTAFGYLAGRYGFRQVSILGANPEAEPTPATLVRIVKLIEDNHISTIYAESLGPSKVATTVAREAKVKVATLDTLESPPTASDYTTLMRQNQATIVAGQGCAK